MTGNIRRNTLILVAGMLVSVSLYVLIYWLPHKRYVARMQSDIISRRKQIDLQRSKLAQLAVLYGDLAVLSGYSREMADRVPATLNIREFHAAVHDMSEKHGVALSSNTPQIATELVGFQQQPATLTFAGRYHGVVAMFNELETMTPLVEVTSVDLKPTAKPGDPDATLEVKVDLKLFARPAKPVTSKNND